MRVQSDVEGARDGIGVGIVRPVSALARDCVALGSGVAAASSATFFGIRAAMRATTHAAVEWRTSLAMATSPECLAGTFVWALRLFLGK